MIWVLLGHPSLIPIFGGYIGNEIHPGISLGFMSEPNG